MLRDPAQLLETRALGEADDPEVRLVHPEQQRRLRSDCPLVVAGASPVRRSDLDEPRSRTREHVRDTKPVADLDELPARDDDLTAFREGGEREQHRGRVVVDHERGLRAREALEQRSEMILARAALARLEVVLEVRVSGPTSATRSRAASASGARPRLVCTRTPVAFSTRRSEGRRARASSSRTESTSGSGSRPALISSRARSNADRATSTASSCGASTRRSSASSLSIEGRSRRERGPGMAPVSPDGSYAASVGSSSRTSAVSRGSASAPTASTSL